jgi:hypothetical protein
VARSLADDNLDDGDRKLSSDIDRVGWHVVMIAEEQAKAPCSRFACAAGRLSAVLGRRSV